MNSNLAVAWTSQQRRSGVLHRGRCSRGLNADPWPWASGRTEVAIAQQAARMSIRICRVCDPLSLGRGRGRMGQ